MDVRLVSGIDIHRTVAIDVRVVRKRHVVAAQDEPCGSVCHPVSMERTAARVIESGRATLHARHEVAHEFSRLVDLHAIELHRRQADRFDTAVAIAEHRHRLRSHGIGVVRIHGLVHQRPVEAPDLDAIIVSVKREDTAVGRRGQSKTTPVAGAPFEVPAERIVRRSPYIHTDVERIHARRCSYAEYVLVLAGVGIDQGEVDFHARVACGVVERINELRTVALQIRIVPFLNVATGGQVVATGCQGGQAKVTRLQIAQSIGTAPAIRHKFMHKNIGLIDAAGKQTKRRLARDAGIVAARGKNRHRSHDLATRMIARNDVQHKFVTCGI